MSISLTPGHAIYIQAGIRFKMANPTSWEDLDAESRLTYEDYGRVAVAADPVKKELVFVLDLLEGTASEVHRLSDRACVEWDRLSNALAVARCTLAEARSETAHE